jgi:hypothetical protein
LVLKTATINTVKANAQVPLVVNGQTYCSVQRGVTVACGNNSLVILEYTASIDGMIVGLEGIWKKDVAV